MDLNIIKKFKPEYFDQLNSEEKENVIRELISSIAREKGLNDVKVELGDGFGYNSKKDIIIIQDFDQMGEEKISSYEILTGIIHEMRHKEQADKGELDTLIYQGFAYNLSNNEIDAHQYTSKILTGLANFFNDNEFDKYVMQLIDQDYQNIRNTVSKIKMLGYTDKTPEEYAKEYSEYVNNYVCHTNPDEHGTIFRLGKIGYGKVWEENEIVQVDDGLTRLYIKGDNAYLALINPVHEGVDSNEVISSIKEILDVYNMQFADTEKVKTLHFPPNFICASIPKEQYDSLLETWEIKDRRIEIAGIEKLSEKGNILLKKNIAVQDFEGKFSQEQQKVLDRALKHEEKILEVKFGWYDSEELEEMGNIGFFVKSQYKPEYSPEKLALILEGQKRNLNTSMYESLTENQIKEVMLAQINGLSREDVLSIANSRDEAKMVRLKLQAEQATKPKVKQILLDEDFEVTLVEPDISIEER